MTQPTTATTFTYDPSRAAIAAADARLTRVLQRQPDRCASVSEYATAAGLSTDEVIDLLGPHLDSGLLDLEVWGSEIFVHTAPNGRIEQPTDLPQVAPNLWELLRVNAPVEYAYALWRLVRDLQAAGHMVEVHPHRIVSYLGPLRARPYLGIYNGPMVVPVLVLPTPDALSSPTGLLADYERAGADMVAIVCDEGALESRVTAVRRWMLDRHDPPRMQVVVLEAPRFNVTVVDARDGAVAPIDVSTAHTQHHSWDMPGGPARAPDGYGQAGYDGPMATPR